MSKKVNKLILCLFFGFSIVKGQSVKFLRIAGDTRAGNSVNTVISRKNSLVIFGKVTQIDGEGNKKEKEHAVGVPDRTTTQL